MKTLLRSIVFISIILISILEIKAQVGIGTNVPDSSAILELSASDKAFYLPRVALTGTNDTLTISKPKAGFVILNTANASNGTSTEVNANQIYTYDGTQWVQLIDEDTLEEKIGNISISEPGSGPDLYGYVYLNNTFELTERSGEINEIGFSEANTKEFFSEKIFTRVENSSSQFKVGTSGTYEFIGFLNFQFEGITSEISPSFWVAGIQKSTDNGASWNTIVGLQCPYIKDFQASLVSCKYAGVEALATNDLIRVFAFKRYGTNPTAAAIGVDKAKGINYSAGFTVNVYSL